MGPRPPGGEEVTRSLRSLRALEASRLAELKKRVRERLTDLAKQEAENPPNAPTINYDDLFFWGRDWLSGKER